MGLPIRGTNAARPVASPYPALPGLENRYVYVMCGESLVKIGVSKSPSFRSARVFTQRVKEIAFAKAFPQATAFAIEAVAKCLLAARGAAHSKTGRPTDWCSCSVDEAIGAVRSAERAVLAVLDDEGVALSAAAQRRKPS